MKISPRNYSTYDDYADALARDAISALPQTSPYDSFEVNHAKRDAIRAALDVAEELARDKWEAYCEHMEDMYERGVGPAWE